MGKGGKNSEPGAIADPQQQQQQQQQNQNQQAEPSLELLSLPQYQPFLQPDFNAAEFTSHVLAASRTSAQAQAEELKTGVKQLEAALSGHVLAHHEELLQHARRLADTEHALQDVVLSVSSLQASVKRIRAEIEAPHASVKAKTQQLSNIHATIDLLRHLVQRLKLVAKLRQQMAAGPAVLDLAKAAKLLTDIGSLAGEADLRGIQAAQADEEFLAAAAAQIQDQAQAFLIDGMESLSQAKVGGALQVFFNLDQLQQAVDSVLQQHLHEVERSFKQSLDSRHLSMTTAAAAGGAAGGGGAAAGAAGGPGGARGLVMPAPGAAGSWQDKLWHCLRGACDALASGALAVWHLQRVVAKKRDPLSHVLFLDVVCPPGRPLLTERFWGDALRCLSDVFASAARPSKGGFVRDALTAAYPRLVVLLEGAFNRITTESRLKGVPPAAAPEQLSALLDASGPFRDAFLAAALARLSDAVGTAFPGQSRGLPSPADVQKCIGVLHEELKSSGSSGQLAGLVGATVGKSLRLMADKAEYMAAAGPELRQVSLGAGAGGGANPGQMRNIALCSQLQEVHRSLVTLLPRLPSSAAAALNAPLEALQAAAIDTVSPIFKAAMEVLEGIVLSMHQQQWGQDPAEPAAADGSSTEGGAAAADAGAGALLTVTETSAYVNELQNAIAQFRSEYLSKFTPPPSPSVPSVGSTLAERAAGRLLMLWLRHACLLRPLGPGGKLQLAKDLGEVQLVVGQGLFPLEALGPAHRCLRAFRALLFTEDSALVGAACLRDLPPALVLQHCFSRLPRSVKTPAERSGVSASQYSKWLDGHSSADVARSVASTLEAERAEVAAAAASGPGPAAVVALMKQLCGMSDS